MRAREILEENYNQSLESDLNNLLVVAKGSGAEQIETQAVVVQLQGMGYAVDENSLMSLLSRNPSVMNATPTMITMAGPEASPSGGGDPSQDTAARVSDMASKATKIG
jgi:hypothetical protein